MSQYPPNGYPWPGQGYQQPPMPGQQRQYMYQQQGYPQDQAYQSNQTYHVPPPYQGYPPPGSAGGHYAQSQAAFNHNATQIPGLGASSPPTVSPSQPYGGTWGSYGAGGRGTPGKPHQHQAPTQTTPYFPSNGHEESSSRPTAAQAAPTPSKPNHKEPVDVIDDGELSEEGLFDDLYDPDPPVASRSPPKEKAPEPETEPMQTNEASDLDLDNAFYEEDDGDEPGEITSNTNGTQPTNLRGVRELTGGGGARQRSASYSPDLSPREIHNRDNIFQQGNLADQVSQMQAAAVFDKPNGMSASASHPHGTRSTADGMAPTSMQRLPDKSGMASEQAAKGKGLASPRPAATSPNATGSPDGVPMTVDAAKKEAQKSILRLFPYGVKYQTYIDEGFDENVIKSLFADLGLSTSQAPASGSEPAQIPKEAEAVKTTAAKDPVNMGPKATKETAAERAARIKQRLAAVKSAKPSAPPAATTAAATAPSASVETAAPPPTNAANTTTLATTAEQAQLAAPEVPGKPKSRKEALLKQKMEQLQKARHLRDAQSAARKKPAADTVDGSTTNQQATQPASAQSTTPQALGPITTAASTVLPPVSQNLSSSPVGPPRKRPTAADFFEYAGPVKRPATGQDSRPNASLVIDVSGESDDEDVEMELDRDDSAEAEQSAARKGASFRDHPPLTNTRPYASSASSVPPTPPNGLGNGGNNASEDQYSKKMREIIEMKRKIAEIESKKPRKTPMGAQTPTGAIASPLRQSSSDDVDKSQPSSKRGSFGFESMKLPKPSDAGSRQERRVRIASVQLPKVDAHIREKMAKLKIFQDKIASLQREIAQGEAEKQQLTQEMEELADEPVETQEVETREVETIPKESPAPTNGIEIPAQASERVASPQPQTGETGDDVDEGEVVETAVTESEPPVSAPVQEESAPPAPQEAAVDSQTTDNSTPVGDEHNSNSTSTGVNEVEEPTREEESDDAVSKAIEAQLIATASEATAAEVTADEDTAMDIDVDPVVSEAQQDDVSAAPEPDAELQEVKTKSPQQFIEPTVALSDTDMQESSAEPAPAIAQISDVPADSADMEIVDGEAGEQDANISKTTPATQPSFTSYQSPLQYFRSYRFHPSYNANVQGGLKSLTYSSKIKPGAEFCLHELAGNDCTDGAKCQYQHFASLVPKDDQILVELGRSDDFSGETKTRFVAGLREVLQSVRTRKIRDFNSIASEIIEYRRQFLADPSKVLTNLDGVTI